MPASAFCAKAPAASISTTVLSGWAFRYKMLDDGRRQILNYALPADLVGLQGSLMREMEHSVEALTPLVLCVFPRGKLWDLYTKFPSLAFDVTWLAAREEQQIDEHLLSIGRRTALERAAFLLLHLFVRADEAGLTKNGSIQFPFTQQHLADTLGMSLVHTNKTLKRLLASKRSAGRTGCSNWSIAARWPRLPATTSRRSHRGRLFDVAAVRTVRYRQRMAATTAANRNRECPRRDRARLPRCRPRCVGGHAGGGIEDVSRRGDRPGD